MACTRRLDDSFALLGGTSITHQLIPHYPLVADLVIKKYKFHMESMKYSFLLLLFCFGFLLWIFNGVLTWFQKQC